MESVSTYFFTFFIRPLSPSAYRLKKAQFQYMKKNIRAIMLMIILANEYVFFLVSMKLKAPKINPRPISPNAINGPRYVQKRAFNIYRPSELGE